MNQKVIDELKAEIRELKTKNAELEARVRELEIKREMDEMPAMDVLAAKERARRFAAGDKNVFKELRRQRRGRR